MYTEIFLIEINDNKNNNKKISNQGGKEALR